MTHATTAILCTSAPLAAFVLALVFLQRHKRVAAAVAIAGNSISLLCALSLLRDGPVAEPIVRRWMESESAAMMFGVLLDGPNLLMGAVVAGISLLVMIYSLGYMAGDRGWSRYFAFLAFFSWSMLSFVYAASLLQMFIFWELVGLSSFLLIGFWYEKPAAAAAGRKAFVMTRIGDVGLFVGLILLMQATGTLDIAQINDPETLAQVPAGRLSLIALLFFCGVVGKSAQFPLHTWLPDAMEGPTPVSALLHSATMVAAGVFLFARFHGLFLADPQTTRLVMGVAVCTALLSATVAMVQLDIKRVLAYSSISQLSFMLLGLAAGSLHAGLFHLTTHAFFKALLFLCAGAYIHRYGSNDMVALGRAGARFMRGTTLGVLVGGAALAGVPPLSGFFSKENVLAGLATAGHPLVMVGAYAASLLTAYYTFRMIFLLMRPNLRGRLEPLEPVDEAHAHGGDQGRGAALSMFAPILLLAVLAAVAGVGSTAIARLLVTDVAHPSAAGMTFALLMAGGGIAWAWIDFGRKDARQTGLVARFAPLQRLFERAWYIDVFYEAVVGRLMSGVSRLCAVLERRGLDDFVDGVAQGTVVGGQAARRTQVGPVQLYVAVSVLLLATACYLLGGGA